MIVSHFTFDDMARDITTLDTKLKGTVFLISIIGFLMEVYSKFVMAE